MSKFGFDKATKREDAVPPLGAASVAKRFKTPQVSEGAEDRAVQAGERMGFVAREKGDAVGQGGRRRGRKAEEEQGRIFVSGPKRILDRFVDYADSSDAPSYWKALENLMDKADIPYS